MQCEKCGSEIEEKSGVCLHCGTTSSQELSQKGYVAVQPKRRWWKWLLGVLIAFILFFYWVGQSVVLPQDVILEQLNVLKEGKLTEAYYDFTSKDFQKATTLDFFKNYVKASPVFTSGKLFLVEQETLEGSVSVIRGFIVGEDDSSFEVIYQMIYEDGEWKILSVSPVSKEEKEETTPTSVTQQYIEPAVTFLDYIQTPEFPNVYEKKVSKDFLENTSYKAFSQFVNKNPILSQFQEFEIVQHQLNRGLGEIYITLNPETESIPLAITVVKEDGAWKIYRFSVGVTNQEEDLKTKELFDVVLVPYVKGSLELLKQNQLKRFYEEKTSGEFKEDVTYPLLEQFYNAFPVLSGFTKLTVKERGESGDLVWIEMELQKDLEKRVFEFTLGKEGDEWKIWGLQTFDQEKTKL